MSLHEQADAALQAESDRLAALIQSSGDGPVTGDGTFIRPVPGPVTSGFGYRTDPVTGATAYHAGLDIGAPCGTPIKAAGTGSVITAGFNSGGYGNMTLINHGNGLSTPVRAPVVDHRVGRAVRQPGAGDRLRRLDRQVDRVPPPLRSEGQRQPGRPERLPVDGLNVGATVSRHTDLRGDDHTASRDVRWLRRERVLHALLAADYLFGWGVTRR